MKPERVAGFDLARAYAIFGMYLVNFDFCFGSFTDHRPFGHFLNLFIGNSTSVFIILAGIGVTLLSRQSAGNAREKTQARSRVLKRSRFLFVLGLLLYNWWPGDILHFYGGYLHIAAFLLFVPKRYLLLVGVGALLVFHVLLLAIPVTTAWDFSTFRYSGFWTIAGFMRNTFYNGWNAIFPWLFYFMLGMWLGRLNWHAPIVRMKILITGITIFFLFEGLRLLVKQGHFRQYEDYIMSDYFPAYIPYIMITTGFALMVISICFYLDGIRVIRGVIRVIATAGRMSLSLYIIHLTIGMLIFSALTHKPYTGYLATDMPVAPVYILLYAAAFFSISVAFAYQWNKYFKHGPFEALMRKYSG